MLDVPARLATVDPSGFPRITPIWFLWQGGAFVMTSVAGRPHLRNLERDARAAVCVDSEDPRTRANRQAKGQGRAEVFVDEEGAWTDRITRKYVVGPDADAEARRRAAMPRLAIVLRPKRLVAIGSDP